MLSLCFKTHHLLKLTRDAAHSEGHSLRVDSYLVERSNNYLYLSLYYSLLEVLDYYKPYIDINSNQEINIHEWVVKIPNISIDSFSIGTTTRAADNGYGNFQSSQLTNTIDDPPSFIRDPNLQKGTEIKTTTNPSPNEVHFGSVFFKKNQYKYGLLIWNQTEENTDLDLEPALALIQQLLKMVKAQKPTDQIYCAEKLHTWFIYLARI